MGADYWQTALMGEPVERTSVVATLVREIAETVHQDRPVAEFFPQRHLFNEVVAAASELRRANSISIMEEVLCVAGIARLSYPRFRREIQELASKVAALLEVNPSLLHGGDATIWEYICYYHAERGKVASFRESLLRRAEKLAIDVADHARELWGTETRRIELPPARDDQTAQLYRLALAACRAQIAWELPACGLNENDVALALQWGTPEVQSEYAECDGATEGLPSKTRFELATLLSARAAERGLLHRLAQQFDVEDLSVHQLDGRSSLWKEADIRMGTRLLDVKNSRRSQDNPESYSEHCVPRFKAILRTSREERSEAVLIAGVLSHFIWPEGILQRDAYARSRNPRFLGLTSETAIRDLQTEFEGFLEMDFTRSPGDPKFFLPAWLFTYPAEFYRVRNSAIENLKHVPALLQAIAGFNGGRIWPLMSVLDLDLATQSSERRCYEGEFLQQWAKVKKARGAELPFLILTVFKHFLTTASDPTNSDFTPRVYRRALFVGEDVNSPVGIFDPLETVNNLVVLLSQLWQHNRNALHELVSFRLTGFRVLRGRKRDKSWVTLIAYCWKCGEHPLVLGTSVLCELCGFLVCPKCSACQRTCRNAAERLRAAAPGIW